MTKSVAVVGAGLAGLVCARALAARGLAVRVFDKGRGVGGRSSTRRVGDDAYDLGAQYLTVTDPRFAALVAAWQDDGACARWEARLVAVGPGGARRPVAPRPRWVGTPGMAGLARAAAGPVEVAAGHRVDRVVEAGGRIGLRGTVASPGTTLPPPAPGADGEAELGWFDAVVVTAPAPQAAALLQPVAPALAAWSRGAPLRPCHAVGVALEGDAAAVAAAAGLDGAFVDDPASPLAWVARDSSKPGRPPGERWVLHASPAWSEAHRDAAPAEVVATLTAALGALLGAPALAAARATHQRWLLARAVAPLGEPARADLGGRLLAGGDWSVDGRLEGAALAGLALAAAVDG